MTEYATCGVCAHVWPATDSNKRCPRCDGDGFGPYPYDHAEKVSKAILARLKMPARRRSEFSRYLEGAYDEVQQAADYAQANPLTDTENEHGRDRVQKLREQIDRIAGRLYQPDHVKDVDEEFRKLLRDEEER